jgi:hypothetical protein
MKSAARIPDHHPMRRWHSWGLFEALAGSRADINEPPTCLNFFDISAMQRI